MACCVRLQVVDRCVAHLNNVPGGHGEASTNLIRRLPSR